MTWKTLRPMLGKIMAGIMVVIFLALPIVLPNAIGYFVFHKHQVYVAINKAVNETSIIMVILSEIFNDTRHSNVFVF